MKKMENLAKRKVTKSYLLTELSNQGKPKDDCAQKVFACKSLHLRLSAHPKQLNKRMITKSLNYDNRYKKKYQSFS